MNIHDASRYISLKYTERSEEKIVYRTFTYILKEKGWYQATDSMCDERALTWGENRVKTVSLDDQPSCR